MAETRIHIALRPTYEAAHARWQRNDPTGFPTMVAVVNLSTLMLRDERVADLVKAFMRGEHINAEEAAP